MHFDIVEELPSPGFPVVESPVLFDGGECFIKGFARICTLAIALVVEPLDSYPCHSFKEHEAHNIFLLAHWVQFKSSSDEHAVNVFNLQVLIINQTRSLAERS